MTTWSLTLQQALHSCCAQVVAWAARRALWPAQVTANWAVRNVFGKDAASPVEDLTPYFYTDVRDDWRSQLVIVAINNRETPCASHHGA
jgi:hypothetical protein